MQLYALDHDRNVVHAQQAHPLEDYRCLECDGVVRRRGGLRRRHHFWHVSQQRSCRQNGKGPIHLYLQQWLQLQLPPGDVTLERPFPQIGRIADVCWEPQRIIFEVQCAPLSGEEALARSTAYQSIGWQVIWILHERRYGMKYSSSLELALSEIPHYYTDMDQHGRGGLYDCLFYSHQTGKRQTIWRRPLELLPIFVDKDKIEPIHPLLQNRAKWPIHLAGDFLVLWSDHEERDTLAVLLQGCKMPYQRAIWTLLKERCAKPWRLLWQYWLEQQSDRG